MIIHFMNPVTGQPVFTLQRGNTTHNHLLTLSIPSPTTTTTTITPPTSGNPGANGRTIPSLPTHPTHLVGSVCVKHLNRCKTSTFEPTFQVFTGIISRDFKQWNFYFCAYLPGFVSMHYFKLFQARGIESRGTDPAGQSTECLPSVGMVRVEPPAPRRPPPETKELNEQDRESRGTDPAGQSTECLPSVGMVRVKLSAPRRPPPKDEQDGESRGTDPDSQPNASRRWVW